MRKILFISMIALTGVLANNALASTTHNYEIVKDVGARQILSADLVDFDAIIVIDDVNESSQINIAYSGIKFYPAPQLEPTDVEFIPAYRDNPVPVPKNEFNSRKKSVPKKLFIWNCSIRQC